MPLDVCLIKFYFGGINGRKGKGVEKRREKQKRLLEERRGGGGEREGIGMRML